MKDDTKAFAKQKLCLTLNDAIEKLKGKLPQFLQHVYVKQQELFFEKVKENIQPNTLLLHFDFSENYSFFSQDEIQSAHWVSTSCTIYTAMAYFVYDDTLKSVPIVVVSNYLHHDKYAVTVFNNALMQKIKHDFPQLMICKVIYKSDGTAQHFKQKYSICLAMLQPGDIEWHFTATGHGKGPVDGVGRTIKHRVREATLARKINPRNAEEFFHTAKNICKNVNLLYISETTVEEKKNHLDQLCSPNGSEIFSIPNTRKFHCFIKIADYILKVANVSLKPKQFTKINLQTGEVETKFNEDEPAKETFEINFGNWILVPFLGKCKIKYFAGQIRSRGHLGDREEIDSGVELSGKARDALVVEAQLLGQMVPDSKPDSIKNHHICGPSVWSMSESIGKRPIIDVVLKFGEEGIGPGIVLVI
ncbi:hypothetical protein AVEN_119292-1 [Araneus ventricosus]|uniref:Uncharacterized protein n=1 Tax=Araneus ventricosus TaxID=182803 RepID=A0A4Y2EGA1_ARAVE|nr:hypothetical protein AVEN_119292-1 [Araneus ventricosus]